MQYSKPSGPFTVTLVKKNKETMEKKNYLVVGGSSGIGLSIVKQLNENQANITVLSRTNDQLQKLSKVQHIKTDVIKDDIDPQQLPEAIHGLVYCPGTINLRQFRALKVADFQNDFEINVLGAVKVIKAAQKALKKAGHSSLVLFSTVAVQQGMPFHTSIAAAKGAVEGMTKSLAAELAPKIRVNCIAPSLTDTPLAKSLLSSPERREASDKRHPLRRIGTPEDIANLAVFLLSEKSSWLSGQVLGLDGGLSTLRV